MSLDKAIEHGKERRKPYAGSERVDVSCRPHGGGRPFPCEWCRRDRLWHAYREQAEADEQIRMAESLIQDERDMAAPEDAGKPSGNPEETDRFPLGYERLPCGCIRVYPWLKCRHGN